MHVVCNCDSEQAPRHRHDSVSIDGNDGISNPSSVQSSMSVNSPGSFDMYDSTPNEYASARFAESNRIDVIQPMTPPQRPFVAVRPQVRTVRKMTKIIFSLVHFISICLFIISSVTNCELINQIKYKLLVK